MRLIVLGSGSKGNATLVEAGATRVLIDNGFSCTELLARLRAVGVAPESIGALLLTHEHNDHVGGAGVLARRLNIPVYGNVPTLRAAEARLGEVPCLKEFDTGDTFAFEALEIHAFSLSHDTADPVGFTLSDGRRRIGCCTDTGRITRLARHELAACDALILEANHDVDMLRSGPYPLPLQQRVLSSQGHLDNPTALDLAAELAADRLRRLVLAHLSETNNHPDLVRREITARRELLAGVEIHIASQHRPTPWMEVGAGCKARALQNGLQDSFAPIFSHPPSHSPCQALPPRVKDNQDLFHPLTSI